MRDFRLLCLGDSHGGSTWGLWPKGYRHSDGEHKLTKFQTWLGKSFDRMVEDLPPLDGVIHLGDAIDGKNPYSGGRFCITPEPADQAAAMVVKLSALRKKCAWMRLIDGTESHDDTAGGALDLIGSELKCDKWAPGGHYSDQALTFRFHGKVFNFQHHSPTGMLYLSSLISKKHMYASVAERDNNLPSADFIASAHLHCGTGGWTGGGRHVALIPCFAGPSQYVIKKVGVQQAYALWTVGAVLITINDLGMGVQLIRFPLPPMPVEEIA